MQILSTTLLFLFLSITIFKKKKQKKTYTHTLLTKCSISFGSSFIIHHVSRSFMFMLDKMNKLFSRPFPIIKKYVSNKNIPTKKSLSIAHFLKCSHTRMLCPTKSKLLPLAHFPIFKVLFQSFFFLKTQKNVNPNP